jgi:hypothetical protein
MLGTIIDRKWQTTTYIDDTLILAKNALADPGYEKWGRNILISWVLKA